jgi:hypothetical protein
LGGAAQFAVTTVVGGTVSVIGGGKFANGAAQAGFGYLFSQLAHERNNRLVARGFDRSQWQRVGLLTDAQSEAGFIGDQQMALSMSSVAGPLPTNQFYVEVSVRPLDASGNPIASVASPEWFKRVPYAGMSGISPLGTVTADFVIEATFSAPRYEWLVWMPPQPARHDNAASPQVELFKPRERR